MSTETIEVPVLLTERPQGRTGIFGREMLVYGIDREAWLSRERQESLLAS